VLRDVFNGILFLQTMPSGMTCTYPSCFGGWSVSGQRDVTVDTAHSYHTGYDQLDAVADCMIVSDGDWGGTAHEVGHMVSGNWGHPSDYDNGFDTMDSGWPFAGSFGGYTRMDRGGDPSTLTYGRRADGTVIGNGDDPCLDHENRLYARVKNFGTMVASNVVAHFDVTRPLGVGIQPDTSWDDIGSAPPIPSIAPGDYADVYVPWVPTAADVLGIDTPDRFAYHSCFRTRIDSVPGEVVTANQDGDREQENVTYFQIRRDPMSLTYAPIVRNLFLSNLGSNFPRTFWVGVESQLPASWSRSISDDVRTAAADCCVSTSAPGCAYPSIEQCVCASDSYCCLQRWDSICVNEVTSLGCGACHGACVTGARQARQDDLEGCVCARDTYCCATYWDSLCVQEVGAFGCGTCAGGGGAMTSIGASETLDSSNASTAEDLFLSERTCDPTREPAAPPPPDRLR